MIAEALQALHFETLVDIGCGGGEKLLELAAQHPQARFIGIESDQQQALAAAERVQAAGLEQRVAVRQGDALRTGVADGWANVVTYRLSLHHVTATEAAFAEAARLLKPGGRLIIYDGVRLSEADFAQMNAELVQSGYPPEPLPGFEPAELAQLLRRQGFQIENSARGGRMTFATPPYTSRAYETTAFLLEASRCL